MRATFAAGVHVDVDTTSAASASLPDIPWLPEGFDLGAALFSDDEAFEDVIGRQAEAVQKKEDERRAAMEAEAAEEAAVAQPVNNEDINCF